MYTFTSASKKPPSRSLWCRCRCAFYLNGLLSFKYSRVLTTIFPAGMLEAGVGSILLILAVQVLQGTRGWTNSLSLQNLEIWCASYCLLGMCYGAVDCLPYTVGKDCVHPWKPGMLPVQWYIQTHWKSAYYYAFERWSTVLPMRSWILSIMC